MPELDNQNCVIASISDIYINCAPVGCSLIKNCFSHVKWQDLVVVLSMEGWSIIFVNKVVNTHRRLDTPCNIIYSGFCYKNHQVFDQVHQVLCLVTSLMFQLWHRDQVDEGREQDAEGQHQPRDQQVAGPPPHPRLRQAEAVTTTVDGSNLGLCQKNQLLWKTWVELRFFLSS